MGKHSSRSVAAYGNYDPTDKKRCCSIRVMPIQKRVSKTMTINSTPPYQREDDDMEIVEFLIGYGWEYKKLTAGEDGCRNCTSRARPALFQIGRAHV